MTLPPGKGPVLLPIPAFPGGGPRLTLGPFSGAEKGRWAHSAHGTGGDRDGSVTTEWITLLQ